MKNYRKLMKTRTFIVGLLSLLTLPTFIACDDDDFTYYTDMATVENEDGRLILQSDNCGELIPENPGLLASFDADNENQRIIAAFNFIDKDNRSNYGVELYDIYRVLTKDIYQMPADDETKNDSIGNDPIVINRIMTSPKHINFYFMVRGNHSDIKHFINLITVGDNPEPDADGTLHMEFRHNNEGDHPRFTQWGWAAFPLESIPGYSEGKTKRLFIKVNEGNNVETIITYDLENDNETQNNQNAKMYSISDFSNTKTK